MQVFHSCSGACNKWGRDCKKAFRFGQNKQAHSLAWSITWLWVLCTPCFNNYLICSITQSWKLSQTTSATSSTLFLPAATWRRRRWAFPGRVMQLWDCWEAHGRQLQSLTGHSDLRKAQKSPTGCVHPPLPCAQTPKGASCEPRTAFAGSSPLLSLQHFDAEKKGTEHGAGSTFLFHLTFKSHLHQLPSFICTIQPELSKPLQISGGQREKSSPFPGRATRMLPGARTGLGSKPKPGALSSGLYQPLGQPESLLFNIKKKRTEILLQKVLCLSASGQVTDGRWALQSLCIHWFIYF